MQHRAFEAAWSNKMDANSHVLFLQSHQFFLFIIQSFKSENNHPLDIAGGIHETRPGTLPQKASDAQHLAFQSSLDLENPEEAQKPFNEDSLHLLTSLGLGLTVLLQADSGDGDETSSLSGREVTNLVHARLGHVVQLLGLGRATKHGDSALVGTATDLTVDGLLGSGDGRLQELTLGREVETVVKELRSCQ